MNIVYPERWQHKVSERQREAVAYTQTLRHLEEDLRAAGFVVAADLVAAGEFAVWQDVGRESSSA